MSQKLRYAFSNSLNNIVKIFPAGKKAYTLIAVSTD
jgi:hypothetical protein